MTKAEIAMRDALLAARPIVEEVLQQEIESYSTPEAAPRKGSVRSSCGLKSYYNPDTINEVDAARSVRRCKRVIKQINSALDRS